MLNQLKKIPIWFYLFILALALRLWGITHGLPVATHPDENTVVRRALRFGSGDLNPHFFYYSSLSMYLFFVAYGFYFVFGLITGLFHSTHDFAIAFTRNLLPVYLISRIIIAVFDSITTIFVVKIVQKATNLKTAIFAGLWWAFFPLALYESKIAKPDPMMLCLAVISTFFALSDRKHRYLWSALFIGLAASAKYQAAVLLVPTVAILVMDPQPINKIKTFFLMGVISFFGFVAGTPYALLDFPTFYQQFSEQSKIMAVGKTGLEGGPQGWALYLHVIFNPENSAILAPFILIGLASFLIRRKKEFIYPAITVSLLYVLLGRMRIIGSHYFYVGFPYLLILAAYGFFFAEEFFKKRKWASALFLSLFLASLASYLSQSISFLMMLSHKDTRLLAYEWITNNIPANSTVLTDASGPTLPMSKEQLASLYDRAKAAGHVKADLFKLQLEAADDKGYRVWLTEQAIMTTPPELLAYSRQVQDLISIGKGIKSVKEAGVQYVITSETEYGIYEMPSGKEKYPDHARFYSDLKARTSMQADFDPNTTKGPGPHITIYKL